MKRLRHSITMTIASIIILAILTSCSGKEEEIPDANTINKYFKSLSIAIDSNRHSPLKNLICNPIYIYNYKSNKTTSYDNSYLFSIIDALQASAADFIRDDIAKITPTYDPSIITINGQPFKGDSTSKYMIYKYNRDGKEYMLAFRVKNKRLRLEYAKSNFGDFPNTDGLSYEMKLSFYQFYRDFLEILKKDTKENIAKYIVSSTIKLNEATFNRYSYYKTWSREYPIFTKEQNGNSINELSAITRENIAVVRNGKNKVKVPIQSPNARIICVSVPLSNKNKTRKYYFVPHEDKFRLTNTEIH